MPTFPREVRQVLLELEMVSAGKTQSFDAATGKSDGDNPRPFGDQFPEFLLFRERFERAPEHQWPAILQEARDTLNTLKRQAVKPKGESEGDLERRVVAKLTDGWSPQEVADWARVTVRFVMGACERQGFDPLTGRPLDMTLDELLALNPKITVRDAAARLGMSRMTVHRRMAQAQARRQAA